MFVNNQFAKCTVFNWQSTTVEKFPFPIYQFDGYADRRVGEIVAQATS